MRSSKPPAVLAGFLVVGCCFAAGATFASGEEEFLSVEVTELSVGVTGVSPGGRVAILASDRQLQDDSGAVVQVSIVELVEDDDADGSVTFDRGGAVSQGSVWIAVEVETGRVGSATSWGEPISPFTTPLGLARPIETGPAVVAADNHDQIHLLLVRPGIGAWSALGVDGGLSEETGVANGRVTFYEVSWQTLVEDQPLPGDRLDSDLLFALDAALFAADARRSGDLTWLP